VLTGLCKKIRIWGFSVQCTTYPAALNIAKKIRERISDVKIVFGGHNASFVDTATLEAFPFVDCIVRGERGEHTFAELVEAYEGGLVPFPWQIDGTGSVWWKIRNHKNHFEMIRSWYVKATR